MKKIKNLLIPALFVATLLLVVFGVSSCVGEHPHTFADWETVSAPTCNSVGLQKRACGCGYVEYATAEALPHTPVTDAAVEATCTTLGKTEGSHCDLCGTVIVAQTDVEMLAHAFSAWESIVNPSCTSFGLQKRACDCGYVEYNTAAALGHTPVTDAALEATCTTPGMTEGSHCGACGVILAVQNLIPPTGHSCDEVTVLEEALCNLDGTKRFSCSNDGCSYYYDESYSLEPLAYGELSDIASQYTGSLEIYGRLGEFVARKSAFVISADGKIVTTIAALKDGYSAIFKLGENSYEVTQVLAYDAVACLAVLQIDATDLPYAKLCTRAPVAAEPVYTAAVTEFLPLGISCGIVSDPSYDLYGEAIFIQHDADMSQSYGGGPLLNRFGEVIGINVGFLGSKEDDDTFNVSTWVAELEHLDYSNPMTLEEYATHTSTPLDQLEWWIMAFANGSNGNNIAYVIQGTRFYYSLGYDTANGYCFAEASWSLDDIYSLYICVYFDNCEGTYQYYAIMTDGVVKNETFGYIDAATFNESTILTYEGFYGRYWPEAELMQLYSNAACDVFEWFSYCLDTYFDTLSLESFGFTELSYDRDENALDKLNLFVVENGTFNPTTGAYEMYLYNELYTLSYYPAVGDRPASTVLTMIYLMPTGEFYSVSLTLDPTEYGNRFEGMYALYNGSSFDVQSSGWGYVDANTLTNTTPLTCYVFDGMNDYEDALLLNYAALMANMLERLNDFMPNVEPGLSIKDLGFLFYFG